MKSSEEREGGRWKAPVSQKSRTESQGLSGQLHGMLLRVREENWKRSADFGDTDVFERRAGPV